MKRGVIAIVLALAAVALVTGCGNSSGNHDATETASARFDAATVTAVVSARATGAPGTQATGAAVASGSNPFVFATLVVAPNGGARSPTTAAGRSGTAQPAGARGSAVSGSVVGSTYTDAQGRFRFTVPQGWQTQQPTNSGVDVVVVSQSPQGLIQIESEPIPAATSLDEYTATTMADIQSSLSDYTPDANGVQNVTVGGEPAKRFDFTSTSGGGPVHFAVFLVKRGGTAYVISLASRPADFTTVAGQAQIFLQTFTFLTS